MSKTKLVKILEHFLYDLSTKELNVSCPEDISKWLFDNGYEGAEDE